VGHRRPLQEDANEFSLGSDYWLVVFALTWLLCHAPRMPKLPASLVCPRCGARPRQPCDMFKGKLQLVHLERIRAATEKDLAAKKARRK
jgi:hypothetical protein